MNRYQLAKLVSWAKRLETRKRLQKVVFLLQAAGCPLVEAEFTLLHYGPYSEDLARLTDEMVRQALLDEEVSENPKGKQYSYQIPTVVKKEILEIEKSSKGRKWKAELGEFEEVAKEYLKENLQRLEHASTIVYFQQQGFDWETAVEKAIKFKKTETVRKALPFAKKVISKV